MGGHERVTGHKWKDNLQELVLLRFSDLVALPLVAGSSHQTCFCFLRQEFTTWSSLALNNATLPQPPNPPTLSGVPTWVTSVISQGFMLSSPPQPQCEPKILRQPPGSRVPWFPKGSQLSVGPECVAAAPVLSLPCSREPIST